jgi:precorrin-8X/cobalt-precorrin-8 methylmutase
VDAGARPPAVILGLPVGMVAAAESKAELLARRVPYVTLLGTRGGSPLAAAALNALTEMALDPAYGG